MPASRAPPAAFASRSLVLTSPPVGAVWRRLYPDTHPNPLGWGPAINRFSDPTGKAFGVVYLGSSAKVTYVEVIYRDRGDGRDEAFPIPFSEFEGYICAKIAVDQPLRLVDLTGDGPLLMGVPSDVIGASDQTLAQQWSAAFHAHPEAPDGVFYPSRLNEERNIALFDRALGKLKALEALALVDCRDDLAGIITDLRLEIV